MKEALVIMKRGDDDLDEVWKKVYIPALKECGLEPQRVDTHAEGRLLSSEIVEFIRRAEIIIADLTGERIDCYLGVSYAMDIGKFSNLILCIKSGEIVHFNLSGYDILKWDYINLKSFKAKLIKEMRYRLKLLDGFDRKTEEDNKMINNWIDNERKRAREEFKKLNIGDGFLEVIFIPKEVKVNKRLDELLEIAKKAGFHYLGWPIGAVLDKEEFRPQFTNDGIRTIIKAKEPSPIFKKRFVFDYWMLRKDGHFYFLRDFYVETESEKRVAYIDIRVFRIAEVFLYCRRLFKELGFRDTDRIKIFINHEGLKGRILATHGPYRWFHEGYTSNVENAQFEFEDTLENIEKNIKANVYEAANELILHFDSFPMSKVATNEIFDKFFGDQNFNINNKNVKY